MTVRLVQLLTLTGLVACGAQPVPTEVPHAAAATAAPAPEARQPPAPDPCEGVELATTLAEAQTALESEPSESLDTQVWQLDLALGCDEDLEPSQALQAAQLMFTLIERAHGAPGDPAPGAESKACKTNSEGVCVYKKKKKKKQVQSTPTHGWPLLDYDDVELLRLAALSRYATHAPPSDELCQRRYEHAKLAMQHNDWERARPLLEAFIADYDGDIRSAWAAGMLTDLLAIEVHEPPWEELDDALADMRAWLERLPSLKLWEHDEVAFLRRQMPTLLAGVMWRQAMYARDLGSMAIRAWNELDDDALEPPPDPGPHFMRCAEQFMQIDRQFEDHDKADTLLWNAADCYDAAYSDRSIEVRKQLLERFPDSPHAQETLLYLAEIEESQADYADASTHYLEFAQRYPKDKRSADAWLAALRLAEGLGQSEIVSLAERGYIDHYKRKDPQHAGRFMWSRAPSEPRARAEYAQDFLKVFGKKGGHAPWLDAQRAVVEHDWARACRQRLDEGLCVARRPASSQCTLSGEPPVVIRARDNRRLDTAKVGIRLLRKLDEALPRLRFRGDEDEPVVLRFRASAAFHQLEPELEAFLLAGPDVPDAVQRAETLDAGYRALMDSEDPDPNVALRAAWRRGLIWEQLANHGLVERQGACEIRSKERDELAQQLRAAERATQAYRECVELARAWAWFNDAAHRCERALTHIEPERTPAQAELLGEPAKLVDADLHSVGVLSDPWRPYELDPSG